ncbi:MAG: hypothetical protein ACI30S_01935 [Muribaculaceae bacterium]
MKKVLVIAFLMLVCANFCKAQDVIVMQDGSTVLAKVLKVTKTEVTYKKHNNLQGPDYTANVSDIVSINYENGTKETFNPVISQTQVQSQTDIYTSEVQTSDVDLLKNYNVNNSLEKQIKKKRTIGWVGASVLIVGGIALLAQYDNDYSSGKNDVIIASGSAAVALGCVWCYCWIHSANKMKKEMEYMNVSLFEQNILSTKNGKFVAGVDAIRLNNNMNLNSYGVGMSLRYNF